MKISRTASAGCNSEYADRIDEVDATWVLPGHGPAWDQGVTEAVRLTREAG
jgi:hypothetical protein